MQVLDIQAELKELGRNDLAGVLQEVQTQEKQNLRMVSAGKAIWFNTLHVEANFHVELKMVLTDVDTTRGKVLPEINLIVSNQTAPYGKIVLGFEVFYQVAPQSWCL